MRLFWHGDNKRTNKQVGGLRASPLLTTEKASLLQLEANLVDHFCRRDFMTPHRNTQINGNQLVSFIWESRNRLEQKELFLPLWSSSSHRALLRVPQAKQAGLRVSLAPSGLFRLAE